MKKNKWLALLLGGILLFAGVSALAEADITDILLNGKTTQAFTDDAVSSDDLNTILLAGINAQSAMNSQPWHFSVIADSAILTELGGSGMPGGAGGNPPEGAPSAPVAASGAKASLTDAAVAVVVSCTDTLKWNSFDAGAACDRMSVAARMLGYGTKIVAGPCDTINADDEWRARLGISDDRSALAILLIGVTDESVDGATGASVRNPLSEVVTFVE